MASKLEDDVSALPSLKVWLIQCILGMVLKSPTMEYDLIHTNTTNQVEKPGHLPSTLYN